MFYIGSTKDLRRRFQEHINGRSQFTKRSDDWKLIYYEAYQSYKLAFDREMVLKGRSNSWKLLKKRILEDEM